jgi:hypothetical protein
VFKGCNAANVAEYYDKTECVRDNATGLIWQGQTPAGTGLRGNDQEKTNYDSTQALQKRIDYVAGVGGIDVAPTQAEIDAITNTVGFKNAVNATNLCGSSAWRLPTEVELNGIVKGPINSHSAASIDSEWFPNTPVYSNYWTSSPWIFSSPQQLDGAAFGKVIDFFYGGTDISLRTGYEVDINGFVRLVR